MRTFSVTNGDFTRVEIDGQTRRLLTREAFDRFNPSLLGLGKLTSEAVATDSIAAMFDLDGFTTFCKQIEPHLSVPVFLSAFLEWLMDQIKMEMTHEEFPEGIALWGPLPFFVKFMGDGLLVLWDVTRSDDNARRNIIVTAREICLRYQREFYPRIEAVVTEPPPVLRCGLARGTVFSVGNRNDFVGSCINMASRLQKLPGITFAFNRRGIKTDDADAADFFRHEIVVKRTSVRGIGDKELVCIPAFEFEAMPAEDRARYEDV
jgi:class 3 adenylate cyclase